MKEKKKKIIILSAAIVTVIAIIAGSTYAYWQITKTQTTPNDIVAACLDLNLEDKSAAIDLDSAWPISDDEASSLTGYTFTVTNNCDEEINYIVGLNRVEESNYLQDSSVKVRLDEQSSQVYGDLSDVEYADSENTYTSRVSKQVSVEAISANGTNEHTIRVWVSEDAPVTEQSKIFQGQVFITGGQGIELRECFTIANDGTLLDYNIECGTEVKIPAEINGIRVKEIDGLFLNLDGDLSMISNSTGDRNVFYFSNTNNIEEKESIFLNLVCGSEECPYTSLEDISPVIYGKEELANYDWDWEVDDGTIGNMTIDIDNNTATIIDLKPVQKVTSLDLSEAIYLETIDDYAFHATVHTSNPIPDYECIDDGNSNEGYYCGGKLTELIMPVNGSLKTIGSYSFNGNKLTEVFIPNTVETIGDYAFANIATTMNSVTTVYGLINKVVFEDTLEKPSYLNYLSGFNNNQISTIKIPASVKTIGEYAFANNQITKAVIPGTVTSLEAGSFCGNGLTDFILVREDQTGLDISSSACSQPRTYNPNYTE